MTIEKPVHLLSDALLILHARPGTPLATLGIIARWNAIDARRELARRHG